MRGRKHIPSALRKGRPEPGEPVPPDALPRCPGHLTHDARKEWRRLAKPLYDMGVLSVVDRGALAAYCQAYARWVEAERKLKETPTLLKAPSGYVQQSPWLSIANKQLELMGRYMAELGLTPAARRRIDVGQQGHHDPVTRIECVFVGVDEDGNRVEVGRDGERLPPSRDETPVRVVRNIGSV